MVYKARVCTYICVCGNKDDIMQTRAPPPTILPIIAWGEVALGSVSSFLCYKHVFSCLVYFHCLYFDKLPNVYHI